MRIRERIVPTVLQISMFVLCCVVLDGAGAAQTLQQKDRLNQIEFSVKGPDLFRSYCAACHGTDAKGTGPVAPALKAKVSDLTFLARNNRGSFPSARVRSIIMGDEVVASHGSRDMPIWGPIFHETEKEQALPKDVKLANLLQYLESIQQK